MYGGKTRLVLTDKKSDRFFSNSAVQFDVHTNNKVATLMKFQSQTLEFYEIFRNPAFPC